MSRPKKQIDAATAANETAQASTPPAPGPNPNDAPPPAAPPPAPVEQTAPVKPRLNPHTFAPHKHPDHPNGPDLDPALGTKTPAFVEYLEKLKAKGGE